MATRNKREFDVVVFGATGFTGGLVCEVLRDHRDAGSFKWAIAGRSESKLDALASNLGLGDIPRIIADSDDAASLGAMVDRTRTVLTTVGPYAKYGAPLVAACAAAGTHYVDITGEPAFWLRTIQDHHDEAVANKAIIVSCCGFDSIPADVGAYVVAKELGDNTPKTVEAFVSANGSFSGGTWNSAMGAMAEMRSAPSTKDILKGGAKLITRKPYREKLVNGWVVSAPLIDPLVVKRSAALSETSGVYGEGFSYGHYIRAGSAPMVAGMALGIGAIATAAQIGPIRRALGKLKPPGDGPDAETRAKSKFRVTYRGQAPGQEIIMELQGGDPGYTETSKMIAECALCLAKDTKKLPSKGGVLTPASAMGDALVDRLAAVGLSFDRIR